MLGNRILSDINPKEGEETQPILKYERLGNHIHTVVRDDAISCVAIHIQCICIGTYNGNVMLLHHNGCFMRKLHQHYKKVTDLHIDETGQFIASCSDDGTVAVYTLFNPILSRSTSAPSGNGEINIYNYYNSIQCIRFQDKYSLRREKVFACGGLDGQFLLNKKGWILDKEINLHEGEGAIQCIEWKDDLVAWANDWGVKVYDVKHDQRVTFIERPHVCPPFELCRCHLVWKSSKKLIVAWANIIRIIELRSGAVHRNWQSKDSPLQNADPKYEDADAESRNLLSCPELSLREIPSFQSHKIAEIVAIITLDYFVSGITMWSNSFFCVLGYRPVEYAAGMQELFATSSQKQQAGEGGENGEVPYPELHVIGFDGKVLSSDLLPLRGYQQLRASDYKMVTLQYTVDSEEQTVRDSEETNYSETDADFEERYSAAFDAASGCIMYICAPKDVILCRSCNTIDRVKGELLRMNYRRAVEIAAKDRSAFVDADPSFHDILEYYLGDLIHREKFATAAVEIQRLFVGKEFETLWEKYVYLFAQRNQLGFIAKYAPTGATLNSIRLPSIQYEMILRYFLDSDPEQLVETLRKWPKPQRYRNRNTPKASSKTTEELTGYAAESPYIQQEQESLYDPKRWIQIVEAVIRQRRLLEVDTESITIESAYIMEALAELYSMTGQYDQALRIYLSQGAFCTNKAHVFKLINENQLWSFVQSKVLSLVSLDSVLAIQLLVSKLDHFPVFYVAQQLDSHPSLLFQYLHSLWTQQSSVYNAEAYAPLHEKQVQLYLDHSPQLLLEFLRSSVFVSFANAYQLCEAHMPPVWEAIVFLLSRIGREKDALELILTQLQDLQQAIEFVQSQQKSELWDYLIELSLSNPSTMQNLLESAASHQVDPIQLIQKIPTDMHLCNLKATLVEILGNYKIQVELCVRCMKSFEVDRMELHRKQVRLRKRAMRLTTMNQKCALCKKLLRAGNGSLSMPDTDVIKRDDAVFDKGFQCVYPCGHCFHYLCLEECLQMWKFSSSACIPAMDCLQCFGERRKITRRVDDPKTDQ